MDVPLAAPHKPRTVEGDFRACVWKNRTNHVEDMSPGEILCKSGRKNLDVIYEQWTLWTPINVASFFLPHNIRICAVLFLCLLKFSISSVKRHKVVKPLLYAALNFNIILFSLRRVVLMAWTLKCHSRIQWNVL